MAQPETPVIDRTLSNPPRPRRLIPISLQMLAALLVMIALLAAWRGYQRLVVIQEIEWLGGRAISECAVPDWLSNVLGDERTKFIGEVVWVDLNGSQAGDCTLRQLCSLTNLKSLQLDNTSVSDGGLLHIRGLKGLFMLQLASTRVSDAGLLNIGNLKNLEFLCLNDTQVSDAGLVHLKGLEHLQSLWLNDTLVSDAGLAHLQEMSSLQKLFLNRTRVTDAGLAHLKKMANLRELWISSDDITVAGLADLQLALPQLKIDRVSILSAECHELLDDNFGLPYR